MFALLLTAAVATSNTTTAPNQKKIDAEAVRKAIDDICGDTWCEGDFQFKFHRVALNTKNNSTQIYFQMNTYPDNFLEVVSNARIQSQTYQVSCNIPGYSTVATIMDSPGSLNWDFYTIVSDCINSLEKQLHKVNAIN